MKKNNLTQEEINEIADNAIQVQHYSMNYKNESEILAERINIHIDRTKISEYQVADEKRENRIFVKTFDIYLKWKKEKNINDLSKNELIKHFDEILFEVEPSFRTEIKELPAENRKPITYSDVKISIEKHYKDKDITKKVDKINRRGNQKYEVTEGEILIKIRGDFGDINKKQEETIITHIKTYRRECEGNAKGTRRE